MRPANTCAVIPNCRVEEVAGGGPRRTATRRSRPDFAAGYRVLDRRLYLNQVGGTGGGSPTVRLYRISSDWGEGTAGNTVTGASGTGQGFAAGTGDATWNARHFSATTPTLWSTAGGDFAAIDGAASIIVGTTLNVPYTWGSTSGMVSDVQSWLNSPATNFGWMLKNDDESGSQTVRGFWTREASDPTRNPQPGLVRECRSHTPFQSR